MKKEKHHRPPIRRKPLRSEKTPPDKPAHGGEGQEIADDDPQKDIKEIQRRAQVRWR